MHIAGWHTSWILIARCRFCQSHHACNWIYSRYQTPTRRKPRLVAFHTVKVQLCPSFLNAHGASVYDSTTLKYLVLVHSCHSLAQPQRRGNRRP